MISLESLPSDVVDVLQDGTETTEKPVSAHERLASNVSKLQLEIADATESDDDDYEDGSEAQRKRKRTVTSNTDESEHVPESQPKLYPTILMQQRIFYALEEIKLTHDLVSRMLPSTNSEPPISSRIHIPPRPTPSNSQQQQASATAQTKLKVSMVPQKPPLPIQSQVESIQLTLSSKREHAITVSKYFEDAFRRLQGAQQREHQFYSQYTLNLMRHRWIPQSDYFGAGPGRSFRNLHVDYGLRGAGSFLKDVTRAELVRETGSADGTEDDLHHEDAVELWIPHNVSKVVEVRLDSAMKEKGEDGRPSEQRAVPESWSRFSDHSPMTPMRMLANAQLTVFYTDLFNAISFEMTKNHSTTKGARTFAKTISIPLQADRVLNISLVSRRVESAKPQSLPSLIPGDPSFDHALMQLGLERALRSQQSELMKRLQSERRPTLNVPDSNSIPIMGGILRWVLFWDRCRQIDSIIKPSVLRKAVLQHSASSDRGPVGPLPILSVMRNSKPDEGGQGCQVRWTISSGGKRKIDVDLLSSGTVFLTSGGHTIPFQNFDQADLTLLLSSYIWEKVIN